jgi:hypothetical protein
MQDIIRQGSSRELTSSKLNPDFSAPLAIISALCQSMAPWPSLATLDGTATGTMTYQCPAADTHSSDGTTYKKHTGQVVIVKITNRSSGLHAWNIDSTAMIAPLQLQSSLAPDRREASASRHRTRSWTATGFVLSSPSCQHHHPLHLWPWAACWREAAVVIDNGTAERSPSAL